MICHQHGAESREQRAGKRHIVTRVPLVCHHAITNTIRTRTDKQVPVIWAKRRNQVTLSESVHIRSIRDPLYHTSPGTVLMMPLPRQAPRTSPRVFEVLLHLNFSFGDHGMRTLGLSKAVAPGGVIGLNVFDTICLVSKYRYLYFHVSKLFYIVFFRCDT